MILDIYRKAYDARYKPCEHAAAHKAGIQAVAEAVREWLKQNKAPSSAACEMFWGEPIPAQPHADDLRLALNAALAMLARHEPGDSRAVSDEFVALASVAAGKLNNEGREILTRAILTPKET